MEFNYNKIKDPEFFEENRIKAHSDHRYFASEIDFAQNRECFRKSLDGIWKFRYSKNFEEASKDFYTDDKDCRAGTYTAGGL